MIPVRHVNIEAVLIGYFNSIKPRGLLAYGDVPADRPQNFISVELVGGELDSVRALASVAIQVWGESRAVAMENSRYLRDEILPTLPVNIPSIHRCSVSGYTNWPDFVSKHPRYQIVADLVTVTR